VSVVLLLVSCGSLRPGTDDAVRTARDVHRVGDTGSADHACGLLAPEVVAELTQASGKPCAPSLQAESPPDPGQHLDTRIYGRAAQVVFERDVVFLSVYGSDWKVTAMICAPMTERPYACAVKGH
jgi:hypothetical protein